MSLHSANGIKNDTYIHLVDDLYNLVKSFIGKAACTKKLHQNPFSSWSSGTQWPAGSQTRTPRAVRSARTTSSPFVTNASVRTIPIMPATQSRGPAITLTTNTASSGGSNKKRKISVYIAFRTGTPLRRRSSTPRPPTPTPNDCSLDILIYTPMAWLVISMIYYQSI